jgi:hypothetical protein
MNLQFGGQAGALTRLTRGATTLCCDWTSSCTSKGRSFNLSDRCQSYQQLSEMDSSIG